MINNAIYRLQFNAFKNKFDKEILPSTSFKLTWDELLEYFSELGIRNDKDGMAFNLCLFSAPKCEKKNVVEVHAMILDYDSGQVNIDDIKTKFQDYQHFGYTSYSHLKDGLTHKFRVIIPLTTPCPIDKWDARKKSFIEFAGGYYDAGDKGLKPVVDGSSFDASRVFYLPACSDENKHLYQFWTNTGKFLNWTELEEEAIAPVVRPSVKLTGEIFKGNELNTTITLANNRSGTVIDLYQELGEGYDHRQPCYGLRQDSKPGAFVFREGGNLILVDKSAATNKVFQVEKTVNVLALNKKGLNIVTKDSEPLEITSPKYFYKETGQLKIEKINEQYVQSGLELSDAGLIFIKSPKGTGKTYILEELIKDMKVTLPKNEGVLVIGHRVNLLHNLSERLSVEHYLNEYQAKRFYAISLDSFSKRLSDVNDIDYSTVIIDEIEQVLNHLTSDTLKRERKAVFSALVKKIRAAKRLIVLDADLSFELTIEILKKLRGDERWATDDIQAIINEYQVGLGREVQMVATKEQLLMDLLKTINETRIDILTNTPVRKNNVFVATNSKKLCEVLKRIIVEQTGMPEKDILTVHADNTSELWQELFIRDPSYEGGRYKVVIASPTISTGVSIDGKHFNHVYGFFYPQPFNATDCDQAISRVRNKKATVKVWMNQNKLLQLGKDVLTNITNYAAENQVSSSFLQEQKEALLKLAKAKSFLENEEDQLNFFDQVKKSYRSVELKTRIRLDDKEAMLDEGEELWVWTLAKLETVNTIRMKNRYEKFIKLNEENGFTVIYAPEDKEEHKLGKDLFDENDYATIDQLAENIYNANNIGWETAEQYGRRYKKLSQKEKLELRKYQLGEWLIKSEKLTQPVIKRIEQERMLEIHYRLELALKSISELEEEDKREHIDRDNSRVFTDYRHRVRVKEYLDDAVAAMNFADMKNFNELFLTSTSSIIVEDKRLTALSDFASQHIHDINKTFDCKLRAKNLKSKWVWDAMFGYVGLPLKYKKVAIKGTKLTRWQYSTDIDTYDLVLKKRHESSDAYKKIGRLKMDEQLFKLTKT